MAITDFASTSIAATEVAGLYNKLISNTRGTRTYSLADLSDYIREVGSLVAAYLTVSNKYALVTRGADCGYIGTALASQVDYVRQGGYGAYGRTPDAEMQAGTLATTYSRLELLADMIDNTCALPHNMVH